MASSSSSLPCVNSKLFVISRTSLDILCRRSLVFCNWDFKISLSFFSCSPSSSLIISLIVLIIIPYCSFLSSLSTEVVGVLCITELDLNDIFGADFDLFVNCLELIMVT